MGRSPFKQPVQVEDLEGALRALRESGHRVTAARRIVLEALFAADGPVSADHLAQAMGGESTPMDTASVHRNLAQLEELGLVRHVHIGHGPGLYALVGEAEREYLACERCGRVTTVEPAKLDPVRRSIRRSSATRRASPTSLSSGSAELPARDRRRGSAFGGSKGDRHEHAHSHGDYVHSHPHVHGKGGGEEHEHGHDQESG